MKHDDFEEESKSLEDWGVWQFSGDVDDEQSADVIRWIIEENFESRHEMLTLIINSPGGYVSSGLSVVDAMAGSTIPIRTVGMGIIASMGLLIFIAGKKGDRILTPNTLIMSHQFAGGIDGKEHELIAGIKRDKIIGEMIMRHFKKHTGLTEKMIRKHLLPPSDVYLTAKEALELNLCDQIRLV